MGERLDGSRQPPKDIYLYLGSPEFLAMHPVSQAADAAQYTARNQALALQWQGAQVRIQGPRARDFFTAFAKGSATGIKANGADILSVQLIQPPSSPRRRRGVIIVNVTINKKSARLGETAGSFATQFFPSGNRRFCSTGDRSRVYELATSRQAPPLAQNGGKGVTITIMRIRSCGSGHALILASWEANTSGWLDGKYFELRSKRTRLQDIVGDGGTLWIVAHAGAIRSSIRRIATR